jgi:hypothetical protein
MDRLLYEMAAQCCISETQTTSALVTLLVRAVDKHLHRVLQRLARHDATHSRLGWAYLEWARKRQSVAFLGPLLRPLVADCADDLFRPAVEEAYAPELFSFGVVPVGIRRAVYLDTLDKVVLPGFEGRGVDGTALRRWVRSVRARLDERVVDAS